MGNRARILVLSFQYSRQASGSRVVTPAPNTRLRESWNCCATSYRMLAKVGSGCWCLHALSHCMLAPASCREQWFPIVPVRTLILRKTEGLKVTQPAGGDLPGSAH